MAASCDAGVGDGDTIGETIGDGVMTGCALAANVVAAPAITAPPRMTRANHRFIEYLSSSLRSDASL